MATTTPRLGLPRPEATDAVTLENEQALIDAIDGAAAAQADFDAHISDKSNPHNVTPAQIGAETPAGVEDKINSFADSVSTKLVYIGSIYPEQPFANQIFYKKL